MVRLKQNFTGTNWWLCKSAFYTTENIACSIAIAVFFFIIEKLLYVWFFSYTWVFIFHWESESILVSRNEVSRINAENRYSPLITVEVWECNEAPPTLVLNVKLIPRDFFLNAIFYRCFGSMPELLGIFNYMIEQNNYTLLNYQIFGIKNLHLPK